MASHSDIETWLAQVSLGDRAAFSKLYDATSPKLFGVCLRVLNNRAEAEEVLQEAFVRVWQMSGSYAANGYSPMTWLITVTRNLAIDRLRARRAPTQDIDTAHDLASPAPGPEAAVVASGEMARITACLDELEQGRADAIRGAYLMGETYQELSARLGVPLNTIRTWLRRSLMRLKDCVNR